MRTAVLVALLALVALAAGASARSPVRRTDWYNPYPTYPTDYYPTEPTPSTTGGKCSANINSAAMMCAMNYAPVCGYFGPQVQCFAAPCAQTFGNSCSACASGQVAYWEEGECPSPGGTGGYDYSYYSHPVKKPPVMPPVDYSYYRPVMPLPDYSYQPQPVVDVFPPVMPRPTFDWEHIWGGPLVLPVRPTPSYWTPYVDPLPPTTTPVKPWQPHLPVVDPLPHPIVELPPDLVDPFPQPVYPDMVLWADGGGLQAPAFTDYFVAQPTGVQCATVRFAMCTKEYMPVCAAYGASKNAHQTVSNGCTACTTGAISYVDGACETDTFQG